MFSWIRSKLLLPLLSSKSLNQALFQAAKDGNIDELKSLLAAGASPNALDENNVPPIFYAVLKEKKEVSMALLAVTDRALLGNKHSSHATTSLHLAAHSGWLEFIQAAIKKATNFNVTDSKNMPPIFYAVLSSEEVAMALLPATSVDCLKMDHSNLNINVLQAAALGGLYTFITAAIQKGIDLSIKNNQDQNALDAIKASEKFTPDQKFEILSEHAWARRGALVFARAAQRKAARAAASKAQAAAPAADA
ncbi:MAG: C-terminus family protein [Gammaproteobacteria bacterium]|jgi:ankyrin repeat protein|nr:C-terminus family protein [Gammaproteobacteria bacterium]